MKIKCRPEDFEVREVNQLPLAGGPFAVYTLKKRSIGTLEAVDVVLRQWNLRREQTAVAGLKDRHAVTVQRMTVKHGPKRSLRHESVELEYLGQAPRPTAAGDIASNEFRMVLRDLSADELKKAEAAAPAAAVDGLPNYFDNQRFGSLGESGEFIGKPWCLGNYERAVWLALADMNKVDKPDERRQKQLLAQHWGDWIACKAALERSHRRSIVTYLVDKPGDFRGALARVRQDLRSLWLAAYQSSLWNRMLALVVEEASGGSPPHRVTIGGRDAPFLGRLSEAKRAELHRLRLPLPSARLHEPPAEVRPWIDAVLAEEGLELRELRVKYPRDSFFSRGDRPAVFLPKGLTWETAADDLYPGQSKFTVAFSLPRGSYATILVKRLTEAALDDELEE